ncbi:zinc finger protein 708 [Folsomia candida]|nr:zinc finger protein 708 [Folsomia candida]XP_035713760.1 zinc finger protein 708 [Folsomia candida]
MDVKSRNKWECLECSKTFKTKRNLEMHVFTHDPNAKVKCEICGKISKNPPSLSSHMALLHTDRERPSCKICHRVFFSAQRLQSHIDTFHSTRERPRFQCEYPGCEITYLSKGSLRQHVKTEHAENPVRFPCSLCGKEFKTRAELGRHIPTHTTEKPYNCSTCGSSFSRMENMKRHELTHLEKSTRDMYQCPACPQTFTTRSTLQLHVLVVLENQRNYPCAFCYKRFAKSSDLNCHMKAMHATNEELVHFCDKCEYKSHSKRNLATHRVRHNAARHNCYFCGKKFFTFQDLVRHTNCTHTLEK